MSTCLTLGVTILASTTEIKAAFSSQCTVGEPVWSAKDSMYLLMALFLLTDLHMHIIYPSAESEAMDG